MGWPDDSILATSRGSQFDPKVVDAFLRIRKSAELADASISKI